VKISVAILDINLGGDATCAAACAALKKRDIPFMFYSGYVPEEVMPEWQAPDVSKPASLEAVTADLSDLLGPPLHERDIKPSLLVDRLRLPASCRRRPSAQTGRAPAMSPALPRSCSQTSIAPRSKSMPTPQDADPLGRARARRAREHVAQILAHLEANSARLPEATR